MEHPRDGRINVLFLCSRNQWRSPTAEQLYRRCATLRVRSAGTSAQARRRVQVADLIWADVIVFMEAEHKTRVLEAFGRRVLTGKTTHVLEIPDEYRFMDPELVELLQQTLDPLLLQA